MDFEVIRRLLAAFERDGVRYAIFGAVALKFSDLETQRVAFDGLTVTVVSAKTLYDMKKDTVRLKDRADAQLLRERFGFKE